MICCGTGNGALLSAIHQLVSSQDKGESWWWGSGLGALQNSTAETELVSASRAGVLHFGTKVLPYFGQTTVCAEVQYCP